MRLAVFAASIVATVAAVGGLNWWVDPFADRYDDAALAAALARERPCFISHTVVGDRTWPEFKLDLVRRRHATTLVVGTSRVWKLAGAPGEAFANVSLPGIGVRSLRPLFADLDRTVDGTPTVYLGAELGWFSRGDRSPKMFDETVVDDARYVLSGETLRATVDVLRRAPGAIRHPRKLRHWDVVEAPAGCLIDRDRSVLNGATNAWGPDGTWWWQWEVAGGPERTGGSFVAQHRSDYVGRRLDPDKVAKLEDALAFARDRGWRVIGFAPPFARSSVARLVADDGTAGLYADFRTRMPQIFERYGFAFRDFTDVASVPCTDDDFTWDDGAHVDAACAERLRRKLFGRG